MLFTDNMQPIKPNTFDSVWTMSQAMNVQKLYCSLHMNIMLVIRYSHEHIQCSSTAFAFSLSLRDPMSKSLWGGLMWLDGFRSIRKQMIWLEVISSQSGKSNAVCSLYNDHDPITSHSLNNLEQPFRSITSHCSIYCSNLDPFTTVGLSK